MCLLSGSVPLAYTAFPALGVGGGPPCERTGLFGLRTGHTHTHIPAQEEEKKWGRITPERRLTGPLQGQKQGRTWLRHLARSPREGAVPPEQDQTRGQNTEQQQDQAATWTRLAHTRQGEEGAIPLGRRWGEQRLQWRGRAASRRALCRLV